MTELSLNRQFFDRSGLISQFKKMRYWFLQTLYIIRLRFLIRWQVLVWSVLFLLCKAVNVGNQCTVICIRFKRDWYQKMRKFDFLNIWCDVIIRHKLVINIDRTIHFSWPDGKSSKLIREIVVIIGCCNIPKWILSSLYFSRKLRLVVNSVSNQTYTYNTVGFIRGRLEPGTFTLVLNT